LDTDGGAILVHDACYVNNPMGRINLAFHDSTSSCYLKLSLQLSLASCLSPIAILPDSSKSRLSFKKEECSARRQPAEDIMTR